MIQKIKRCPWAEGNNILMQKYHDQVWGKLTTSDQKLFEYLTLEIFQAGLSWETIINKQAAFILAFDKFKIAKVANYSEKKVAELIENPEIIRNRRKISATINNAKIILSLQQKYGSFNEYLNQVWPEIIINHPTKMSEVPAKTPAVEKLTKTMKKDGFKFVGPTIIYSFLQAIGRINDHLESCSFKY